MSLGSEWVTGCRLKTKETNPGERGLCELPRRRQIRQRRNGNSREMTERDHRGFSGVLPEMDRPTWTKKV